MVVFRLPYGTLDPVPLAGPTRMNHESDPAVGPRIISGTILYYE